MDPMPLVTDEIEAGSEFLRLLNAKRRVIAACWLRQEEGERYLNVALDGVNADNKDDAYADIRDAVNEMTDHYIDVFRIKVLSPDHRIARAILDIYRHYPKRTPTRPSGGSFGGIPVADVYVYPPVCAVA